jgi:hypothetical protein
VSVIDITGGRAESSFLEIHASDSREIMRLTPDGQVIVNPEFTVDEAARAFWDAVQKLARR